MPLETPLRFNLFSSSTQWARSLRGDGEQLVVVGARSEAGRISSSSEHAARQDASSSQPESNSMRRALCSSSTPQRPLAAPACALQHLHSSVCSPKFAPTPARLLWPHKKNKSIIPSRRSQPSNLGERNQSTCRRIPIPYDFKLQMYVRINTIPCDTAYAWSGLLWSGRKRLFISRRP